MLQELNELKIKLSQSLCLCQTKVNDVEFDTLMKIPFKYFKISESKSL